MSAAVVAVMHLAGWVTTNEGKHAAARDEGDGVTSIDILKRKLQAMSTPDDKRIVCSFVLAMRCGVGHRFSGGRVESLATLTLRGLVFLLSEDDRRAVYPVTVHTVAAGRRHAAENERKAGSYIRTLYHTVRPDVVETLHLRPSIDYSRQPRRTLVLVLYRRARNPSTANGLASHHRP
jgi:hypothetical protein